MLRLIFVLMAAALLGTLSGCGSLLGALLPPLETASSVDLNRYTGKWYEIARYPTFFQAGCASSTAEYTVNDDGTIRVFNTCLDVDGTVNDTIQGVAQVIDAVTNAKLKVTFPGIPFAADYWIIELGDNYEYAVVGEPTRSTLFILSRTTTLDEDKLNAILARLPDRGYDPTRLVYDTPVAVP